MNLHRKKIVFMLQNGIGFGHFRTALTIASYIDTEKFEVIFITQAKSTIIFNGFNYRVYNFPLLWTLKKNNDILLFHTMLNLLLEKICPDVVIEDTYPDDLYLNLPSLINVPKILLLNRLMPSAYEDFYYNNSLSQYNKIITLRPIENVIDEILAPEVRNYFQHSGRVVFCDTVFNEASSLKRAEIRRKYHMDEFDKVVVVNCGAGGWHVGENICRIIFETIVDIAKTYSDVDGYSTEYILLTGPYTSYNSIVTHDYGTNKNIIAVEYETDANALFAEADICVLRPGFNSTMEALAGQARIILIPGISYMEEQEKWCAELQKYYGIDYVPVERLNCLKDVLIKTLKKEKDMQRQTKNDAEKVAMEITNMWDEYCLDGKQVCLAVFDGVPENLVLPESVDICICIPDAKNPYIFNNNICIPIINTGTSANETIIALYNDTSLVFPRKEYYEKRYHWETSGKVLIEFDELIVENASYTIRLLANMLSFPEKYQSNICLKRGKISESDYLKALECIIDFLCEHNIKFIPLENAVRFEVTKQLGCHKWKYMRPEIAKLGD